jgi:hypothetical protein
MCYSMLYVPSPLMSSIFQLCSNKTSFAGRTFQKEFPGHGKFQGVVGPLAEMMVHGPRKTPTGKRWGYLVTYEDGDQETLTHARLEGLCLD